MKYIEYIESNPYNGKFHINLWDPKKRRYPEGISAEGDLAEKSPLRYMDKKVRKTYVDGDGWLHVELFI